MIFMQSKYKTYSKTKNDKILHEINNGDYFDRNPITRIQAMGLSIILAIALFGIFCLFGADLSPA